MQNLEAMLSRISDWVWGPPLLILLFGTHLFLTVRLRFIQRYLLTAIRISFRREKEGAGDVSQFGALTTALAATIGTGNIVGVATAVAAGGPGAVLWMWLTGVFGIATKYAEALLSVKYRVRTADGTMAGGPMYVLERGMHARWLGIVFAALTAVAAFGIRVSGLDDRWYVGPAQPIKGLYFSGYTEADANPDIGDSTISETAGIGAFAMATAPAIVQFIGGTPADALQYTLEMYDITVTEDSQYQLPPLNFRGTPEGIDIRQVVRQNLLPIINTGIAHRLPGVGQVGAGIVRPPMECFVAAVRDLATSIQDN